MERQSIPQHGKKPARGRSEKKKEVGEQKDIIKDSLSQVPRGLEGQLARLTSFCKGFFRSQWERGVEDSQADLGLLAGVGWAYICFRGGYAWEHSGVPRAIWGTFWKGREWCHQWCHCSRTFLCLWSDFPGHSKSFHRLLRVPERFVSVLECSLSFLGLLGRLYNCSRAFYSLPRASKTILNHF